LLKCQGSINNKALNAIKLIMKKYLLIISSLFLALFVIPATIASAASGISPQSTTTTVSVAVASVITITSGGTVTLSITPNLSAPQQAIGSDTVTTSTNDSSGYKLYIASSSTLVNTKLVSTTNSANTITASAGTLAAPATMATNTWGYCITGLGTFSCPSANTPAGGAAVSANTFAGTILTGTTSALNLIKTTATTASSDTTTVWYGVAVDTNQPSGTYNTTVTYTGVAN